MHRRSLCSVALAGMVMVGCAATEPVTIHDPWDGAFPMLTLRGEHAALLVARPDEHKGMNRANRFDRAGIVAYARIARGQTYFGPLIEPDQHNPLKHDHIAGTAGEFGISSPAGYEHAQPGQPFCKVGVGLLQRVDDSNYSFHQGNYPVVDRGHWQIDQTDRSIVMTHSLDAHGWAYQYQTTIALMPERPGFTITRKLTNTGRRPIVTDYYNHNFTILDDQPLSSEHTIALAPPHQVAPDRQIPDWVTFDGTTIGFAQVKPGRSLWLPLDPRPDDATPWSATFAHGPTKLILHTRPRPRRVVVYAQLPYFSVEPFIDIDLKPGNSMTCSATYLLK
jgi:hypothetical protein